MNVCLKFFISGENENDFIHNEAINLVDSVLEQSVNIICSQQYPDALRSESEHFAITCDVVNGVDIIKSPTIESMSGKSFDDNISVPDFELDVSNNVSRNSLINIEPATGTVTIDGTTHTIDTNLKRYERIERKFERLSSQLDIDFEQSNELFDDDFDKAISIINSDEVNNLQSDFSKISWDESVSATTADMGLSTPDNDIQELPKGE